MFTRNGCRSIGLAVLLAVLVGGSATAAAPSGAVAPVTHAATAGSANALRSLELPVAADVTVGPDVTTSLAHAPLLTVDASPQRVTYLRFDLDPSTPRIVSAVVHLHVTQVSDGISSPGSGSGGRTDGVTNDSWTEDAVNWTNRPAVDGLDGDTAGAVGAGQWVSFDVTRIVRDGGAASIALTTTSSDGVYFDSSDSGHDTPYLTIQIGWAARSAPGSVVIAAVGDMACPPGETPSTTACQARAVSDAIVHDPEISGLLALGDLQYPAGALADFDGSYDTSYGRLRDITIPAVGNHEYGTAGAAGYFAYFGAAAGDPSQGWTSTDIGSSWHVVVLNSNCSIVSCAAGSPQEQWLRADLAASSRPCTIVMWHHPRFSSGAHGDDIAVAPLWQAAVDAHVEVVLTGHDHSYERFAPQTADGTPSPGAPREFVVGTGGRSLYTFTRVAANSAVRIGGEFGFLRLTLDPGGYGWLFVTADGRVLDTGTGTCRA